MITLNPRYRLNVHPQFLDAVAYKNSDTFGMTTTQQSSRVDTFRMETAKVLSRLRTAFRRAVMSFGNDGSLKSRDLQKTLGLDTRLSWQVAYIVSAEDPLQIGPHVPSPALFKKLLIAAGKKGAAEPALKELHEAYSAFERHIMEYADDRDGFDSLITSFIGGEAEAQFELNHRRSVFEALRYIWGMDIDLFSSCRILYPSKKVPNGIDCGLIRVKHNIRRLNTRASIIVDVKKFLSSNELPAYTEQHSVFDSEAYAKYGMPIMPAYCSRQELPLRQTELQGGGTAIEWISEEVGKPSCVDLVFGDIDHNIPLAKTPEGTNVFSSFVATGTPTRISIHDLWVHRSTFGNVQAEVARLGHAGYPLLDHRTPSDSLPLPELPCKDRVMFLGSGDAAAHLPEFEKYESILHNACESAGWDFEELDLYRLRIEYPILDTMTAVYFSFPEMKTT